MVRLGYFDLNDRFVGAIIVPARKQSARKIRLISNNYFRERFFIVIIKLISQNNFDKLTKGSHA